MEIGVHSVSSSAYAAQASQLNETRAEQWQTAAHAREQRARTRANEPGDVQRVIEAHKVERLNHAKDARELRPITYDNTHLNKVRTFLTVAQNGKQTQFVDLYV